MSNVILKSVGRLIIVVSIAYQVIFPDMSQASVGNPASACPKIDLKQYEKTTIVAAGEVSTAFSVYWEGEEPLIVSSPELYNTNFISMMEILGNDTASELLPKELKVVRVSKLPTEARFCPTLNSEGDQVFTLLVADSSFQHPDYFMALVAHEFVHYIHYKAKANLPLWMQEGIATYIQSQVNLRSMSNLVQEHMTMSPWIGIGYSAAELLRLKSSELMSYYGHVHLFTKYLVDKKNIPLDSALRLEIKDKDIRDYFTDFSIAKFINDYDHFGDESEKYLISEFYKPNRKMYGASTVAKMSAQVINSQVDYKQLNAEIYYVSISTIGEVSVSKKPGKLQEGTSFSILINQ